LYFEIGQRWPEAVMHSCGSYFVLVPKGSLKNKLAILSVEAPGWQGAKAQEYQDISALSERSQAGCIGA